MKASINALWSEFKTFAFKGNMIELAVAVVIGAAFGKVVTAMVDDVVMPAISYAVTAVSTVKDAGTSMVNVAAVHTGLATTKPTTGPTTAPVATAAADAGKAVTTTGGGISNIGGVVSTAGGTTTITGGTTTIVAGAAVAAPAAPVTPPDAKPDPTKVVQFDLMVGRFKVGDFIGSLLNFVIVAFAVFVMIVKLLGSMMSKVAGKPPEPGEPTVKECPYCLSTIPIKARKCSQCTADLDTPVPA